MLNIHHRHRITDSILLSTGVGLKASHCCAGIIEVNKDEVRLIVNAINKCRDRGVKECRITASRQDRLIKPKLI